MGNGRAMRRAIARARGLAWSQVKRSIKRPADGHHQRRYSAASSSLDPRPSSKRQGALGRMVAAMRRQLRGGDR